MVSSHSRSTRPMTPILIPLEDVSMTVFVAFPSGTSSPRAGSKCQYQNITSVIVRDSYPRHLQATTGMSIAL